MADRALRPPFSLKPGRDQLDSAPAAT